MIEFVFTIDYEIYGNGTGLLKDLVYEPAKRLRELFRTWNVRFVAFVEVAELEKIEIFGADPAIDLVKRQVLEFYRDGCEIGLHLHPQWCNARYEKGAWILDYREYNLCTLPRNRISEVVDGSLAYLPSPTTTNSWKFRVPPSRSGFVSCSAKSASILASERRGNLC